MRHVVMGLRCAIHCKPLLMALAVVAALQVLGCSSTATNRREVDQDTRLSRYSTDGREAFDEGSIDEAEHKFRQALTRAWAIDDPYESGTVAYNLAACLMSQDSHAEAADWLVDARVELCRAGASTGNTWLLSAEIAMACQRFEDARRFVDYADRTCPPCEIPETCCLCGPSGDCCKDSSRGCCLVGMSRLADKRKKAEELEQCQQDYQARIQLTRARLAARQLDVDNAKRHLANACQFAHESCDFSLHADLHDVAAAVHDLEADFVQAGAHRDREATLLRCIGHYREIPDVLDAAAESYLNAERLGLATDRLIRSARIRFSRGKLDEAWERVQRASELTIPDGCEGAEIRLSLTAKQIRDALEATSDDERTSGSVPATEPEVVPAGAPESQKAIGDFLELSPPI